MKINYFFLLIIVLVFSINAQSQVETITNEFTYTNLHAYYKVSASIIISITAEETTRLDFGKILPKETKSLIVITPEGKRVISGEVFLVDQSYSSARYSLSRENRIACNVRLLCLINQPSLLIQII